MKDKINKKTFMEKRVMVIGDIMVDEYITGSVKRISPEAPVPVLDFKEKTLQAGGACNVANNLRKLGATVYVCGVANTDYAGNWLRGYLKDLDINTDGIVCEDGRVTTLKTRYATKGQQLLRVDSEKCGGIEKKTEEKILKCLYEIIKDLDAVVLSDYRKGVLEDTLFVKQIISVCNENDVLISIDSKSSNIEAFAGADFVKPNNLELEAAVNIKIDSDETFAMAGEKYLNMSGAKALVVTRGSKGISIFFPEKETETFPARDVQVYDVCGAGDTVISTITMCMISGLSIQESARVANAAAGIVISRVGTVPVSVDELMENL